MLIKKLLKKHKYPPEGMKDAVQTVMMQCELWADNTDMDEPDQKNEAYPVRPERHLRMVADKITPYGIK